MGRRSSWHPLFIGNADFGQRFELFLVASVASVIGIRVYLAATGYPQIGGDGIHVAHMLWGGLFMLLSLFVHSAFLNRSLHRVGAILAGIGFGTFIDELGKFITSDNNYFFQPTIALIYIIFILIYVVARAIYSRRSFTPTEALANAMSLMAEVVAGHLNAGQKRRILQLLDSADQSDPIVQQVRIWVEQAESQTRIEVGSYFRVRNALTSLYSHLVQHRRFRSVIVGGFAVSTLWQLLTVGEIILDLPVLAFDRGAEESTLVSSMQAVSLLVSGLFVVIGLSRMPRSLLDAYRWLQRSVLVQILITQVFVFYDSQLGALGGLLINLLVYLGFGLTIAHLARVDTDATQDMVSRSST